MSKAPLSYALILSVSLSYGCAHNLSSDLLPLDEHKSNGAVFHDLVLAIDEPADKAQSLELEKFVEALRSADLFKAVDYKERLASSDLVLSLFAYKSSDPFDACLMGFEGQILTIGTFGIFPQVCESEYQVSFVLYAARGGNQKQISLGYRTRSIVGWAALFYNLSPDWTVMPEKGKDTELVKSLFYREANEIQRLAR